MANFNIADFKNNYMKHGGARAALFYATTNFPAGVDGAAAQKLTYSCKASQLPSTVIGKIPIPFLGRKVNVTGDRQYEEELQLTIINDEDFLVRKAFEAWVEIIQGAKNNIRSAESIYTTSSLVQKDKAQKDIFEYTFYNCFPTNISTAEVSWESTDQVQEFTVSMSYDYFESKTLAEPTDYQNQNQ